MPYSFPRMRVGCPRRQTEMSCFRRIYAYSKQLKIPELPF